MLSNDGTITTFINPYSYRILRKQRPTYLDGGSLSICFDGMSMALLCRLVGESGTSRSSFDDTSLAPVVFSHCAAANLNVALIGSAPGVAGRAAQLLMERHAGLRIIFVSDGYYPNERELEVIEHASRAQVVVCSMGTPRQEDFLVSLRSNGWSGHGYTCGGFLDQLVAANGRAYYPPLFDALQLRWLYRIFQEPRRLLPRYLIDYPLGLGLFAFDLLSGRHKVRGRLAPTKSRR